MKVDKTNAMRILDKNKVLYKIHTYEVKDGEIDGLTVAAKVGKNKEEVFKTLVTQGNSKNYYVFCVPVYCELDLKKAAYIVSEKNIELINQKNLLQITGYIRGGCSPIGMKKQFKTVFHKSILELNTVTVSGGKIGIQIEIDSKEIIVESGGLIADIIK